MAALCAAGFLLAPGGLKAPAAEAGPPTGRSTVPEEVLQFVPAGGPPAGPAVNDPVPAALGDAAPCVRIGLNFTGPRLGTDSGSIPPDTDGAVGPNHIIVLINGNYSVYSKADGTRLTNTSLNQFWTDAGAPLVNRTFDPRVLFDAPSGRWFACAVDNRRAANSDFKIAVSDTANPLDGWTGFSIDADATDVNWADYPTMGIDAVGVYLSANMFTVAADAGSGSTVLVLPKADLLAGMPTTANLTRFALNGAVGFSAQPAVDLDNTALPARIYARTGNDSFKRSSVTGTINAPMLDTAGGTITVGSFATPPDAVQPTIGGAPKQNIDTGDSRFSSSIVVRDGVVWGVHTVSRNNRAALRWFRLNEAANTLLEEGIIEDGDLAFYYPSIAVNDCGNCVIGFSGSGPFQPISTYIAVGTTSGGVTSFTSAMLVRAGVDDYLQLDSAMPPRNRWGDYSATVADPTDPTSVWTFQEFVSADDTWAIQVTQVIACQAPDIRVSGGFDFEPVCGKQRADNVISIYNTGCSDLSVQSVSVVGSTSFTVLANPVRPFTVQPGSHVDITVRFAPDSPGPKNAILRIVSNDPNFPTLEIPLTGEAGRGVLTTTMADFGSYGNVCVGDFKDLTLHLNNSGSCDLIITNISSDSIHFQVPSVMNFPIVIQAGVSASLPIRFQPANPGAKTGIITIESASPSLPQLKMVSVSGFAPTADIRITGSTDFGQACAGTLAEKTISICNVGACNLLVTNVSFLNPCPDFQLINNPAPTAVSHDFCINVVIRFTPTSCGPKSCTLVIQSNDPDSPVLMLPVTANSPCAIIDVPPDLGFAPEVIQSDGACTTALPFPISNNGECNLIITAITIGGANAGDFSLSGLPSFPIILQPGHIVGEGDLNVVFAPTAIDRDREATLTVTYLTDPASGASTSITRNLCGEGVHTGARVLVTHSGIPIPQLEKIHLQRINANRNKDRLDTQDQSMRLPLVTVIPAAPCEPFQYHREYGTVDNPVQLLPGSYQVTVTAIINGKRQTKSVGFNVDTCDFNANIVVDF